MPGDRGGQIIQGDRLFKIGFWWVIVSIVILTIFNVILFLGIIIGRWPLTFPPVYYWVIIIGFGIMGLSFYIVFLRHNLIPVQFLNKDSRKMFFFSLMFIVVTILSIEVIYTTIFFSWQFTAMDWDVYITSLDILGIVSPLIRLLAYIAIIVIGLAFNKILHTMFGPGHLRMRSRINPRFMINIAMVVGILACIFQAIALVVEILWVTSGISEMTFPVIDLGPDFFIITSSIPFWLGTLLIAIYLVIILGVTMNSIPIQYQHLFIGNPIRMDIKSIFRFSLILILFSSILRMVTGIIFTWRSFFTFGMREENFFDPPFQEVFIVNMYYIARFLSPLIIYLGFAFVCLCFHHIFRAWEFAKLAEPGKPT